MIFLLAILIQFVIHPAQDFTNKQGDNIQPLHTPFPVWKQSIVPCPVLTLASCPTYIFLRRQVMWSGNILNLVKNIPQFVVIHTKSLTWSMKQK